MDISTRGLVLREVNYKDSDKILTVLTEREGRITVSARSVRRRNSKNAAACQFLAFSEMVLYDRNGKWYLRESRTVELFQGLRNDIELLALGAYFAELLDAVSDEDSQNVEILALGLSALYILSKNNRPQELIKAVFEIKLMCLAGYEPHLNFCPECKTEHIENPVFDINRGTILCGKCQKGGQYIAIGAGALEAMRFIVGSPDERVFSFKLGEDSIKSLGKMSQTYLLSRMERGFKTLEYWKGIR